MVTPVESVEDLARQTEIRYGIVRGGSTQSFFEVISPVCLSSAISLFLSVRNPMSNSFNVCGHLCNRVTMFLSPVTKRESIEFGKTFSFLEPSTLFSRKSKGKYAFLLDVCICTILIQSFFVFRLHSRRKTSLPMNVLRVIR